MAEKSGTGGGRLVVGDKCLGMLEAAREKAQAVVQKLRGMRLKEAAKKVEKGIEETLAYYAFPSGHWLKIRTNNVSERLNREIRRCTRVVGTFPDGESALMLACARLRHVTGTQWGIKRYMSMKSLVQMDREKHGADYCDLAQVAVRLLHVMGFASGFATLDGQLSLR